jgi:hypothetical protein
MGCVQADEEAAHRSELAAARERVGALEAAGEQLRAELESAVGKAGAGRAMMEDLAQVGRLLTVPYYT